jgi:hypothetical protein
MHGPTRLRIFEIGIALLLTLAALACVGLAVRVSQEAPIETPSPQ